MLKGGAALLASEVERAVPAAAGQLSAPTLRGIAFAGQRTVNATQFEKEFFLQSLLSDERELSISKLRSGTEIENAGSATSVRIRGGPDVAGTLHTHPSSGVALFSRGDARAFLANRYAADASHSVLGLKWPGASRVLLLEGLEPELDVVKTTVQQGNVVNGPWSQIKINF